MGTDPREALLACAAADGDIAEGALWIAAEDVSGLDPAPWLARIDELAAELRGRGVADAPPAAAREMLGRLLEDRLRLRGGRAGDPGSHYLHTVIETGAGVPIMCAALWIAVGRRAGMAVEGVGLPGHFLVRAEGTLVDAAARGATLDDQQLAALVARTLGERAAVDPEWLRPAPVREMLARMSRNLRSCFAAAGRPGPALRAADRCVSLLPDAPAERRDRGLLLVQLGSAQAALADLRAYVEGARDAPDRAEAERLLASTRAAVN